MGGQDVADGWGVEIGEGGKWKRRRVGESGDGKGRVTRQCMMRVR